MEPQFKGTASHNFVKYTMLVNVEPINTIIYICLAVSQRHSLEKARMAVQEELKNLPANIINKAMPTLLQGSSFSAVTNKDFFA